MKKNKGVALILTVIILTAILAISLTLGRVMVDKIKMSRSTSDSMKAYYAAESGIEYALYQIKQDSGWMPAEDCSKPGDWTAIDGAKYCLQKTGNNIKAIGKAGDTRRGIEIALAASAGITAIDTIPVTIASTLQEICASGGYIGPTGWWSNGGSDLRLHPSQSLTVIPPGTSYVQCYK